MAWIYLILASLGEIFGVTSINLYLQKKSFVRLFFVIITFSFGFYFLSLAIEQITLSTAYAVWTGLGATGSVLMGILFFKEPASLLRIFFLVCIIAGAVGLRLLS